MIALPISRELVLVALFWRESCQSRWSDSEAADESVFSIGGSSLTSDGVRER